MRKIVRSLPVVPFAAVVAALIFSVSNASMAQSANPFEGNPRAIGGGAGLFRAQCATCHGADARGISSIDAPDLTLMWTERDATAAAVYTTIRDGVPGSIMPPHQMTDTELWMLVAYLQSIAAEGVGNLPAGNSSNGERLFARHCVECHRVGSEGGSLGPNLSNITRQRSLDSLITSVRNPSDLIRRGYKPIIVVMNSGERIEGVLKNEDAFSLQMLGADQRLRAYLKEDVSAIERPGQSLMPVFDRGQLGEQDLIDLLNFLDD